MFAAIFRPTNLLALSLILNLNPVLDPLFSKMTRICCSTRFSFFVHCAYWYVKSLSFSFSATSLECQQTIQLSNGQIPSSVPDLSFSLRSMGSSEESFLYSSSSSLELILHFYISLPWNMHFFHDLTSLLFLSLMLLLNSQTISSSRSNKQCAFTSSFEFHFCHRDLTTCCTSRFTSNDGFDSSRASSASCSVVPIKESMFSFEISGRPPQPSST